MVSLFIIIGKLLTSTQLTKKKGETKMFKNIVAIVAMLIVSATAAMANPTAAPKLVPLFHNPIPTYIYTDYRTDSRPGIYQKAHWKPVYVVGVLLRDTGIMYPLIEQGQSVNYCRTPEMYQAVEIVRPSSCRPIFIELYTVPIPKGLPVYMSPFDVEQEIQTSGQ